MPLDEDAPILPTSRHHGPGLFALQPGRLRITIGPALLITEFGDDGRDGRHLLGTGISNSEGSYNLFGESRFKYTK